MFGKNSSQYKIWAEHARSLKNMPTSCQVVNTGSTAGYRAFDYNLWDVKAANLGFQPQPLYYDFETLKKYSGKIAYGAKVLIGIEGFKFYLDFYEDKESDYKYYLWLDKEQIRTYDSRIDWYMHHAPIALNPRWCLHDFKKNIKKIIGKEEKKTELLVSAEHDIACAMKWAEGWNNEFGWQDGQYIRKEQLETIKVVENRLLDMIEYCREHKWEPCVVVLPLSPNLTKLLSDDVMIPGLWEPIERVNKLSEVTVIDFYNDAKFADWTLYENALTLNDKGRRKFNAEIQKVIGI